MFVSLQHLRVNDDVNSQLNNSHSKGIWYNYLSSGNISIVFLLLFSLSSHNMYTMLLK